MEEKKRALETVTAQIERQFGKGAIMRYGDGGDPMSVEAIPTGSIALDLALGIGGVPRGRVVEIFGSESSGKTTLAQHILAEAQRLGGTVAYIDAEHALDPSYARSCGANADERLISPPDTGAQARETLDLVPRRRAGEAALARP